MVLKLVSITPSPRADKKYMATFNKDGKEIYRHFGARGYTDFIRSGGDVERKARYIARHRDKENWDDPLTSGALSRFVLWNKPTLSASIADFKNRFSL
jgi:hypothetical protein